MWYQTFYSSKNSAFHLRKGFLREGSGFSGAVSARRLQWRDRAGISPASTPVRLSLYLAAKTIVNQHAAAIEGGDERACPRISNIMRVRLSWVCHGPTEANRKSRFPADEPLEARVFNRPAQLPRSSERSIGRGRARLCGPARPLLLWDLTPRRSRLSGNATMGAGKAGRSWSSMRPIRKRCRSG